MFRKSCAAVYHVEIATESEIGNENTVGLSVTMSDHPDNRSESMTAIVYSILSGALSCLWVAL